MARSKFILEDDIIDEIKEEVSIKPVRIKVDHTKVSEPKEEKPKKVEEKKKPVVKKEVVQPEPEVKVEVKEANQVEKVNVSLKLTKEQKDYLTRRSVISGLNLNQTLVVIIKDCLSEGHNENDLIKKYRYEKIKNTSIKTIHIPESLRTEVRLAAIDFGLKPVALIEYAIEKARQDNK